MMLGSDQEQECDVAGPELPNSRARCSSAEVGNDPGYKSVPLFSREVLIEHDRMTNRVGSGSLVPVELLGRAEHALSL